MKNFFTKIKYKFFLIFFRQKKKLLWTLVNNLMNSFISVPTISVLTLREDTSLGKKNEKIFVTNDSYQTWYIMNSRDFHKSFVGKVFKFTKSNISYNLIDIGANTGLLTRCLLNNLSNIRNCFLVEPDPDNLFCIKNNLQNFENINTLDCALDLSDGEKKLFIDQNNKGNLSLNYEMMTLKEDKLSFMNSEDNYINVKTKNIKNYFNDIRNENNNIIKIDVQGYDEIIFQEIPRDVLIKTDILFIEITPLKSKKFDEEKFTLNLDLFKKYITSNGNQLTKNEVIQITKRQSGKSFDLIFLN
ncbi:FkbM family methyltransferase [Candidatus Pelagibacter ubique]|nr:FkbM family methyltransferase [Candidatus Pelagibacter ubique]